MLTCKQKWIILFDLGRWHLEEVGIENAVNGITNNAAESMNNIYRNLRSKVKPKPTAELMVELKQLDDRIEMETRRAYHGLSTFSLTKDKKNLEKPPEELPSLYKKRPQLRDYFERRLNNDIIQRAGTNIIIHFFTNQRCM